MREVGEQQEATIESLSRSGDDWELLLIELRRQAMAATLETLGSAVWDEELGRAA